jgi:hypothetical protein
MTRTVADLTDCINVLVSDALANMINAPPTLEQIRAGLRANGYDVDAYDIEFDADARNVVLTPKRTAREIKFTIGFSDEPGRTADDIAKTVAGES